MFWEVLLQKVQYITWFCYCTVIYLFIVSIWLKIIFSWNARDVSL